MHLKSELPGTLATLRQDTAAVADAELPIARMTGAVLYWTGAAAFIALAGLAGGLASMTGSYALEEIQTGLLRGLLVGLAGVTALLIHRRWIYGRVRPPLGRRIGYSYEPRSFKRALLTPVRAGLLVSVMYAAVLEGSDASLGGGAIVVQGLAWITLLGVLYWALESFITPTRARGGHHVMLVFISGLLILSSSVSTAIVVAFFLAAFVHIAISIFEDL